MALKVIEKSTMDGWKSLSAYHTDVQQAAIPPAAINALLPLFLDNAGQWYITKWTSSRQQFSTWTLVRYLSLLLTNHDILLLRKWTWTDTHGEDHFVMMMFGGLHIGMAMLKLHRYRLTLLVLEQQIPSPLLAMPPAINTGSQLQTFIHQQAYSEYPTRW
jgi:hypothetical protein